MQLHLQEEKCARYLAVPTGHNANHLPLVSEPQIQLKGRGDLEPEEHFQRDREDTRCELRAAGERKWNGCGASVAEVP